MIVAVKLKTEIQSRSSKTLWNKNNSGETWEELEAEIK